MSTSILWSEECQFQLKLGEVTTRNYSRRLLPLFPSILPSMPYVRLPLASAGQLYLRMTMNLWRHGKFLVYVFSFFLCLSVCFDKIPSLFCLHFFRHPSSPPRGLMLLLSFFFGVLFFFWLRPQKAHTYNYSV
jgi:hypothetical protein